MSRTGQEHIHFYLKGSGIYSHNYYNQGHTFKGDVIVLTSAQQNMIFVSDGM